MHGSVPGVSPRPSESAFAGLSDEDLRRLLSLALSKGGDYADLYFEHCLTASYVFEDERVKTVGRGISLGLGVRVQRGEATGYAYCEGLDEVAMARAARTAAEIAESSAQPGPQQIVSRVVPSFYRVAEPSLRTPPQTKLDLLRRGDRTARAIDRRIVKVVCSFSEEQRAILIVTGDGRRYSDQQPLLRYGIHVVAEDGTKRQSGSSGGGGRYDLQFFDRKTPEHYAREATHVAIAMLDAVEAPAGQLPVVLAAGDSGILLHEAVGHGLEADFNRKRTSNYSGRVGEVVASELCTVVDDGTVENSRGAINVDDEGAPGQRNVLIENGRLRAYMQDHLSARIMGTTASGNGRRQSFRHEPMPRMTNTYLLAGRDAPEDIIRSVSRGVFARRFSGGQVNISNGDFVFSLTESYLIEDGKLTAPLKGVNLIGNGPDVLTKVSMVGHDFEMSDGIWSCGKDGQSVPVGIGTPTVKIGAITVGGTRT
ncbi:MAG: metalloprotease TldD [Myxococcales bacterium]|nr:metalloprotease TldD [Myxococcales bacterium]